MIKRDKSKEQEEREKNEMGYNMNLRATVQKNKYIKGTINGRYFLARVNMLAIQINTKEIKEKIDGCPKTEEYMRAEYALMKMQAINEMRNAHFAKEELKKKYKFTDEDIHKLEENYYDGKIVRESYDESYKRGNKAEFTHSEPGEEVKIISAANKAKDKKEGKIAGATNKSENKKS